MFILPRKKSFRITIKKLFKFLIVTLFIANIAFLFCEFLIHYIVLFQCSWPGLQIKNVNSSILPPSSKENPLRAMFLADPHLLGKRNGHWLDKLRREWQMYRTFQTAIAIHKPDAVFILGDIFDEGQWSNEKDFSIYMNRFHSIFAVPKAIKLYVVSGNHDMGFHYVITPYLNQRFISGMNAPSVRRVSIRGNHFVLVNSMALEGDGCFLCKPTEDAIREIGRHLDCSKGEGTSCDKNIIQRYSKPILLQHFPMYRESDEICDELDEAPYAIKNVIFREKWDCLSKEASAQLLDILKPRLVIDGHTHHGCKVMLNDTLEITLSSFSWRNKDNPSFLLGVFTPNNYAYSKCYMTVESTVITIYIIHLCAIIYFIIKIIKYG